MKAHRVLAPSLFPTPPLHSPPPSNPRPPAALHYQQHVSCNLSNPPLSSYLFFFQCVQHRIQLQTNRFKNKKECVGDAAELRGVFLSHSGRHQHHRSEAPLFIFNPSLSFFMNHSPLPSLPALALLEAGGGVRSSQGS